ncbi:MAG: divalent-cation tolerance protein CutA [Saprospiraceae bacterium]|nr:divalent-cation tolerance protein CutA [Saprospiraceae bacterium]
MDNKYSVVITTTGNKEDAEKIANALLSEKLAACIQVTQIKSYYTWKDAVNVDEEQLLLVKCKAADYSEIEKCIKANHSYEIPEIILLPISTGLPSYLGWINDVTK